MNVIISCTVITKNRNENKARMIKNMVLDKFPFEFELEISQPCDNKEGCWYFSFDIPVFEENISKIIFSLMSQTSLVLGEYTASGPVFDEETGVFKAFFIHFYRKERGPKLHHCLEELHFMVVNT